MGNIMIMGWDATAKVARRVLVNDEGKLIIDPSEIFEDPPTDGETGKAPNSNWAFDHAADASAHHARYTDEESRAAINNVLSSAGMLTKTLHCQYNIIDNLPEFMLRTTAASNHYMEFKTGTNIPICRLTAVKSGVGYVPAYIDIYNGTAYERVVVVPVMDAAIATHAAIAAAHHERYTDAEAIAAVGYNGTKHWSCPGIAFDPTQAADKQVVKSAAGYLNCMYADTILVAPVLLPHGAVVTQATVRGNAAAGDTSWVLNRFTLSDGAVVTMAVANINTVDSSISYATIDNELYAYYLYTAALAIDDQVWGARITYTI